MRTTLTLDDDLDRELRELAHRSGRSFKQIVNDTLRAGLTRPAAAAKSRPYRLRTYSMGPLAAGVDATKMLQLADELEDVEILRKMRARK